MSIMRRWRFIAVFTMMAAFLAFPQMVSAVSETGRESGKTLMKGVTESTVYFTDNMKKNSRAHILRIDRRSNVLLKVSTAQYYKKGKTAAARKKFAKSWSKSKWGYSTVADQATSYEKTKDKAGNVVAAVNGDYYNADMNGQTLGKLIMEGNVVNGTNDEPYFAVLKDGSYVLREGHEGTGDVLEAIGGRSWVVRNGVPLGDPNGDYTDTYTTLGLTEEGDVVIINSEGREPTSQGTTFYGLGMMMKQQGCVNAILLDCGGSASFLTKRSGDKALKFRNVANDGIPRPVSSSILIVKNNKGSDRGSTSTYAKDMKDPNTYLAKKGSKYQYVVDGKKMTGFSMVNAKSYLFDNKGNGLSKTITLGKTKYTYKGGKLSKVSDKKAGSKVAVGFCGASKDGKNLLYAYHYGDKVLNVGCNPMVKNNNGKMKDWDNIIYVPWQSEKHRVKTIVIGEGVKNVGQYFLYISKNPFNKEVKKMKPILNSVSLPNSLQSINKYAFFNETSLRKVNIPAKVKKIEKNAFNSTTSVTCTFKTKTPPSMKSAFTHSKKHTWKVPKTKKWQSFNKSTKQKKSAGFSGKIKFA